jgi:COP9 signalosome complex subunit 1
MSAILVSIEMGQFTHVTSYINKAEQTADALDPNTVSKLRCAAGLANLDAKKYKLAARKVCVVYFQCILFSINMVSPFFLLSF